MKIYLKEKKQSKDTYYLGTVYNYDVKGREKLEIEDGHIGVFGTTGSGKTTAMLSFINRDIETGKSVFYIDPKGEMFIVNSIYESALNNKRSEEVIILNPMWGDISAKMNPLKIGNKYGRSEEVTNRVLAAIPRTNGDASFFRDLGYELLTLVTKSLVIKEQIRGIEHPEICYQDIYSYISKEGLRAIKNEVGFKLSRVENEAIDRWIKAEPEWFGKVTANVSTATSTVSIGMIGDCLGKIKYYEQDILGKVYDGKKIIAGAWFPSLKIAESAAIASKAIFSALQGYISECQLGRKKAGLRIYIDEAKEAFFPGCLKIFTQARSADVFIRFFAQSYEGIESIIGKEEASEIMQNLKTIFLMKSGNDYTPEKVLKLLAPTIKQIPSQESLGDIRTMGKESYQVEINDILRLEPGQYYCLYKGIFYKGRFKEAVESKINIVEGEENNIEGKINIPYKVIAFRNWLSNQDYVSEHKEYEDVEKKANDLLEKCLLSVINYQGKYIEDGYFTASLIDNLEEHLAINQYQMIKAFLSYQEQYSIVLKDKNKIKRLISYYLTQNEKSYSDSNYARDKYGCYKILFRYTSMKIQSKDIILDCWILKNRWENISKNEKFKLQIVNAI